MTNTICRFLATPSSVFDLQAEEQEKLLSVKNFAIIRLAQCVQVSLYKTRIRIDKKNNIISIILDKAYSTNAPSCYFYVVCSFERNHQIL
jgi:hypothetical protein